MSYYLVTTPCGKHYALTLNSAVRYINSIPNANRTNSGITKVLVNG